MRKRATATFRATGWEELAFDGRAEDGGLPRMTRATVPQVYQGEIEGESTLQYLMVYESAEKARFVGLERFVGTLAGHAGSFVLEHQGVFEAGVASISLSVVEGGGSGALRGLRGGGEFRSPHAESYTLSLDYELEEGSG